jgi:pimeloyl-ACP methyl ester carboxylesterase
MKARISTSTDPVMLQLTSPKGIRVSFQKSGSGPALVLVHGGFSDHHTNWEFVEPLFRGQFTVYALARRNRGDTEATQGHTLLSEAQDVVALIRHVGEPVFLLGHSYGAQCAVNAARLVPALVRKLVLYEAPQPSIMSPATLAALETLAADGAWDAFSFAFFHDVLRVPVADLEALRATDLWPPIVADAPASLGDLRALSGHPFSAAAFPRPVDAGLPAIRIRKRPRPLRNRRARRGAAACLPAGAGRAGARGHDDGAGDVRGGRNGVPARVRRDHAARLGVMP